MSTQQTGPQYPMFGTTAQEADTDVTFTDAQLFEGLQSQQQNGAQQQDAQAGDASDPFAAVKPLAEPNQDALDRAVEATAGKSWAYIQIKQHSSELQVVAQSLIVSLM